MGISAALIPFLGHDDANRALMGANMQTQAVPPLLRPQVPIVSTGMEGVAVADSGQIAVAEADGEVLSVTGDNILVKQSDGDLRIYPLRKYHRSNQSTCIDQRPSVVQGQRIKKAKLSSTLRLPRTENWRLAKTWLSRSFPGKALTLKMLF